MQSIYLKNTKYVPRSEPPSGFAGGKKVFVDRVEWLALKDAQTQLNALLAGEIDMIEQPAFEQYPQLRKDNRVSIVDTGTVNYQYVMRFNHLVPPFNNPKVREAAMWAMNQEAFLRAQVGPENEGMFFTCPSMYPAARRWQARRAAISWSRATWRRRSNCSRTRATTASRLS